MEQRHVRPGFRSLPPYLIATDAAWFRIATPGKSRTTPADHHHAIAYARLAVDTTGGADPAERLLARKRPFHEFDQAWLVHCRIPGGSVWGGRDGARNLAGGRDPASNAEDRQPRRDRS